MDDKVIIDKQTFKALAVDTRVDILKLLVERPYTLSELADMLGLRHSTIKEHLDVLVTAELIKANDEGRKWKYYQLTFKGKQFIQPKEVKVFFAFCFTVFAAIVTAAVTGFSFLGDRIMPAAQESMKIAVEDAPMQDAFLMSAPAVAEPSISTALIVGSVIFGLLLIASAFLLGLIMKKPKVVVLQKTNTEQER